MINVDDWESLDKLAEEFKTYGWIYFKDKDGKPNGDIMRTSADMFFVYNSEYLGYDNYYVICDRCDNGIEHGDCLYRALLYWTDERLNDQDEDPVSEPLFTSEEDANTWLLLHAILHLRNENKWPDFYKTREECVKALRETPGPDGTCYDGPITKHVKLYRV